MKNRNIYYSLFTIVVTTFTVMMILNMRIKTERYQEYDKLDIGVKYSMEYDMNEELGAIKQNVTMIDNAVNSVDSINVLEVEDEVETTKEEVVESEEEVVESEEVTKIDKEEVKEVFLRNISAQATYYKNKNEERIIDERKKNFIDYDQKTIDYLVYQLEVSIRKAKLNRFEELLNQDEIIQDVNVQEIEKRLSVEQRNRLVDIIDKIGAVDNAKLMYKFKDGITPEEQKDIYDMLKNRLTDDEIIELNDLLGKYIDK